MLGGVSNPKTGTLHIRIREEGVFVEGEPPDVHQFPVKFLEKQLGRAAKIRVYVTSDPPLVYDVTEISVNGDLTGSVVADQTPLFKPRWWHRFRRKNG